MFYDCIILPSLISCQELILGSPESLKQTSLHFPPNIDPFNNLNTNIPPLPAPKPEPEDVPVAVLPALRWA